MGGGGQSSSQVNLDPRLQSFVDSILDYAPDVMERPFPNYTLPRIAGFTPDTLYGFQKVRDSVGAWQPGMNTAMNTMSSFAQDGVAPGQQRQDPQYQPTQWRSAGGFDRPPRPTMQPVPGRTPIQGATFPQQPNMFGGR